MSSVSFFFACVAFVQMLMCVLLLAPNWRMNRSVRLFTLLMLCGCGYLVDKLFGPLDQMGPLWWFHYIASNALPGVFWLVSVCIFSDRKELRPWQYMVASLTLLIPLGATLFRLLADFDLQALPALNGLVTYGAMALELVLISHAIVVATAHWQADLVQERRYMRAAMISLTASYLFIVIVVEQVLDLKSSGLEIAKHVVLTFLMLGIYYLLFTLRGDGLIVSRQESLGELRRQQDKASPELQRILDAMHVDRLYREEGMTITALSRHLSIQEYKLRQLINGELGYRNFNDFLNHYRINEVAEKLMDPDYYNTTVLTLALESGFHSLSSFNKAFKNAHGMTPTEFRNRARYQEQPIFS